MTPAAGGSKIQAWNRELTMTSINDITDLVQVLRDNPEWRDTIRAMIVGEDLGKLPDEMATFVRATNENFTLVHQQFEKVDRQFEKIDQQFEKVDQRLEKLDANITTLNQDMAQVRGSHARNETFRNAEDIAMEMGLEFIKVLSITDLRIMTRGTPNVVPQDKLKSFIQADLVIEGKIGESTHYNAVEISFTGHESDAERATRNARFIQQLTGCPARPVIASVKNDPALNNRINTGTLSWYQIASRDLEPE